MPSPLRRLYRRLQARHLGPLADEVPERYWSTFTSVSGAAEHVGVLRRLIEDPRSRAVARAKDARPGIGDPDLIHGGPVRRGEPAGSGARHPHGSPAGDGGGVEDPTRAVPAPTGARLPGDGTHRAGASSPAARPAAAKDGGSRSPARAAARLRVLVVGVYGGRDFWALRAAGHDVTGFDLEEVADCPPTVRGDAEEPWPFDDASFDVVVMGEVLEHLVEDRFALTEARRVLAAGGRLVASVPFLDTHDVYHVRVHDRESILRLLALSGFETLDVVERPGLPGGRLWNWIDHAVALAVYAATRRSAYGALTAFHARAAWALGHERWVPRRLLRALGLANHGCTVLAVPSAERLDYKAANRREFHADAPPPALPARRSEDASRPEPAPGRTPATTADGGPPAR